MNSIRALQPFGLSTPSFSYHTYTGGSFDTFKKATWNDLSKIAGYLPGINVLIGVARLCFAGYYLAYEVVQSAHKGTCSEEDQRAYLMLTGHLFRSLLEIGAGPLLPLVDAIVSFVQAYPHLGFMHEVPMNSEN